MRPQASRATGQMGTWGAGVGENDAFQDTKCDFDESLKRTRSVPETSAAIQARYAEEIANPYESAPVLFAIIDREWTYGTVSPDLFAQARREGFGLDEWSDAPEAERAERRGHIAAFLARISTPNPKPGPIPRTSRKPSRFTPGDCLSIRLEDGRYTAAFVLDANDDAPGNQRDLVVSLDYLADTPPELPDFSRENWLWLDFGTGKRRYDCLWYHARFNAVKDRLSVVGTQPVPEDADWPTNLYGAWSLIGQQVLYAKERDVP